jgi:transposase InsO family protein
MLIVDQKKEFLILYSTGKYPVSHLAEMFEISRMTAYKYIHRYEEDGIEDVSERSRRPYNSPNRTDLKYEKAITELRQRHPRWGASKILILLEDKFPTDKLPSVSTVHNILKRNDLVKDRKRHKKVVPRYPVFNPEACNQIWSADFKGKFRMGNREYCYPLTIADSYSRFVFSAKGMKSANIINSRREFRAVFREYGLPSQIHTDNGAPFAAIRSLGRLSQLSVWFMELGIQPVFSDPAHPEQNGRHERMHRELKAEATRPPGKNLSGQQRKLNDFVLEYNSVRPHQALGLKTPSMVHRKSDLAFPEVVPEWQYPKEMKVRYVTTTGGIRVGKRGMVYLTTALGGKNVGLEPLGNRVYRLYFKQFFLGYADMKTCKMYDIMTYNHELDV